MMRQDKETLAVAIGALVLSLGFLFLGAGCGPTATVIAKKTILSVGLSVAAAEDAWKVADANKQLAIVADAATEEEARAKVGLWRSQVQPKVNQALATLSTAVLSAQRIMLLVEAGLSDVTGLIKAARELYAQFQEVRMLLEMYDVKFSLPGGL